MTSELERQNAIGDRSIVQSTTTRVNISINNMELVYSSFSYLITESIKQTVFKDNYKGYLKSEIITFPNGLPSLVYRILETHSIRHHDEIENSDIEYTYTLDLFNEPIVFKYKNMTAIISVIKEGLTIVRDHFSNNHYFGVLSIMFNNEYQLVFSDLLSFAIKSFDEYRDLSREDNKYTSIYLANEEYWEMVQKKTKRSMDTIYLPEHEKKMIIDDIKNFLKPETKALYDKFCITYKRVFLLAGVPGSGKSSFISALASSIDYGLAVLNFNLKVDDNCLMKLVKSLPKKTFLLLEDIDCLFEDRKPSDSDKNRVSFSGILNSLDGISTNHGFICFMTTNFKNRLEQALIRPGRVDVIYKFDYANAEQIKQIYNSFMFDTFDEDKFKRFYSHLQSMRIKITMSLLSQYLFPYINKPDEAFENIDKIKLYYQDSKTSKEIDDIEIYS